MNKNVIGILFIVLFSVSCASTKAQITIQIRAQSLFARLLNYDLQHSENKAEIKKYKEEFIEEIRDIIGKYGSKPSQSELILWFQKRYTYPKEDGWDLQLKDKSFVNVFVNKEGNCLSQCFVLGIYFDYFKYHLHVLDMKYHAIVRITKADGEYQDIDLTNYKANKSISYYIDDRKYPILAKDIKPGGMNEYPLSQFYAFYVLDRIRWRRFTKYDKSETKDDIVLLSSMIQQIKTDNNLKCQYYTVLSSIYAYTMKQYDKALKVLNKAIEVNPNNLDAVELYVYLNYWLGTPKKS